MASTERSALVVREVAQAYLDAYRTGDTTQLDDIISPAFVDHTFPTFSGGPDGVRKAITWLHQTFADIEQRVEDCVCNEDTAAIRIVTTATHIGAFAGIPATNKRVTWSACDFLRITDGKVTELWSVQDTIPLLRGIGALGARE